MLLATAIGGNFAATDELPASMKVFVVSAMSTTDTERFTNSPIPVEIYDLSLTQKIEAWLSKNLSARPEVAEYQAREQINANMDQIKRSIRRATQAHLLADRLGIESFPAVVINDSFIVYHTTSLKEVLRLWRLSRSN